MVDLVARWLLRVLLHPASRTIVVIVIELRRTILFTLWNVPETEMSHTIRRSWTGPR